MRNGFGKSGCAYEEREMEETGAGSEKLLVMLTELYNGEISDATFDTFHHFFTYKKEKRPKKYKKMKSLLSFLTTLKLFESNQNYLCYKNLLQSHHLHKY